MLTRLSVACALPFMGSKTHKSTSARSCSRERKKLSVYQFAMRFL